jgi:hypothetical protein
MEGAAQVDDEDKFVSVARDACCVCVGCVFGVNDKHYVFVSDFRGGANFARDPDTPQSGFEADVHVYAASAYIAKKFMEAYIRSSRRCVHHCAIAQKYKRYKEVKRPQDMADAAAGPMHVCSDTTLYSFVLPVPCCMGERTH